MTEYIHKPNRSSEYYFEEGCFILELLNKDTDPAVSVARARVRAGETTKRHRLIETVERYVMLEGNGLVEIGRHAKEAVAPGDIVHIPADTEQRITNTGNSDLVFLAICTPRFRPEAYIACDDD